MGRWVGGRRTAGRILTYPPTHLLPVDPTGPDSVPPAMRNHLRLALGVLSLAAAACSHSTEQPAMSDDLKQDLARAGGSDVQLAGSSAHRLDVVSASERVDGATPAPHAPAVSRVASSRSGARAVVHTVRHVSPAPAPAIARSEDIAPAEPMAGPPEPQPAPSAAGRPQAPRPSTQREPRGGWSTPGQVIRNAPFPINP